MLVAVARGAAREARRRRGGGRDGDALRAARELAAEIAANAPLAVQASKAVMGAAPGWTAADRFARQEELIGPVRASADAKEGARAFAEKRPPAWTAVQ